jgi:translocation and assembly module TamB
LELDGTIAAPVVQGTMALENGEIQIEDAGIALQKVELSIAGDGTSSRVGLILVSEESRLTADGVVSLSREQGWQADLTIRAKDFPAADLSEYKIAISPELQLQYGEHGASLRGTVIIPSADIAPEEFADSVTSSRDIVVVDAENKPEKKNLPLALDVNLVMGPEVKVAVHGVKGYLDGSLKIQQEPGRSLTGQGSLSLRKGTYTFRGTTLEIRQGLVFYQGGSLGDPGLNVRAEKKVDDKEVGVQLTGTVSAMEMKLYSSPPMDDSDILAYLVVGRDMSQSDDSEGTMLGTAAAFIGRGTGNSLLGRIQKKTGLDVKLAGGEKSSDVSLVVGKQIAENLYISYGKGLTDSEGVFKTRYQMKHGFSVETKTTSEATGADLFWTLER